jgi:hypothetical protein
MVRLPFLLPFVEQNGQFVEKIWLLPYIILILQPEIDSQFI